MGARSLRRAKRPWQRVSRRLCPGPGRALCIRHEALHSRALARRMDERRAHANVLTCVFLSVCLSQLLHRSANMCSRNTPQISQTPPHVQQSHVAERYKRKSNTKTHHGVKVSRTDMQTDIQPYRRKRIQTYARADIHTHRHTDLQTYRPANPQTYRHADRQTYIHIHAQACASPSISSTPSS